MADHTTVRMYRGILGDCFLIRHRSGQEVFTMLIDCGVLQGVAGGRDTIREVANSVREECGGVLDLVVLTHEHADHLSGFGHAADTFFGGAIKIRKLWLAWTENDQDEQGRALHAKFDKGNRALALASSLPLGAGGEQVRRVAALQRFMGIDAEPENEAPADESLKGPWSGKRVIAKLKDAAGEIEYLQPGEIRPLGVGGALKAYVLGPPRDEARLKKDLPSRGEAKEVYLTASDEIDAVISGARGWLEQRRAFGEELPAEAQDIAADPSPFARPRQRTMKEAHGFPGPVEHLYFSSPERSRIEEDWLDAAEALALKMDSDTNNTSLVLAIELPDRQVMLFAADAQVGNWLSWGDQTYPREAGPDGVAPVGIDDLLSRVTLYKVGHHASHNATLRAQGLEKMTSERLIAMIPVVEAVAKQQGQGWRMPFPELEERLLKKTGDRVLRGDDTWIQREVAAFEGWPHAGLAYADKSRPGGLWVEITIPKRPEKRPGGASA